MSRRGQTDSAITEVIMPLILVAIAAVSFGIMVSAGDNYGVVSDDSSYQAIVDQTFAIRSFTESTSSSLVGSNQTQTNVLTSTERLLTGGYNAILSFAAIPAIYQAVIVSIANTLQIPTAITSLIISAIIMSIVAVILYLVLGRR